MQSNAEKAPGGTTFERIALVRAISGRKLPLAVVHAFSATGAELAVQEIYAVSPTGLDESSLELLEQDARRAMALHHPNAAAVRDVRREGDEVSVVSEFVEGEVLEELRRLATSSTSFTIEVGVRIIVDVLSALSALHTLGDAGLAHGEVTTHNIIVGFDGASRLLRPYRGRVAGKVAEADWFGYAAPEVLKGQNADARSDLFSVGVLLWETLTKRRLFPNATREGRTSRSVPIGKAAPPPEASWAVPLAAVAERALSSDPQARYASAAEMAAAVRLAVRSKLAMPPRVAAVVDKLAGDRILQRRVSLALQEGPTRPGGPSRPPLSNDAARVLEALRPSSRPPTPKPGPVIVPAVPKAPPVPSIEVREAKFHPPEPRPPGPRPTAPALKLSEPKPVVPKVSAGPIAPPKREIIEPEPISLDSALLGASEEFGLEPPTLPKRKADLPSAPAIAAAPAKLAAAPAKLAAAPAPPAPAPSPLAPPAVTPPDEIAAPPTDMLEAVKAFEGKLVAEAKEAAASDAAKKAHAEPSRPPSEKPAPPPILDANVITAPAPQEEPPPDRQPSAASIAPAGIGAQRGRRILIGVGALCLLLLLGAGVRFLVAGKQSEATPPVASQGARRPEATNATPPVASGKATATVATEPASSEQPAPEESAAPAGTAPSPNPDGSSRHHHPRPRPTYDPMGI